jgi:hypothetical protein
MRSTDQMQAAPSMSLAEPGCITLSSGTEAKQALHQYHPGQHAVLGPSHVPGLPTCCTCVPNPLSCSSLLCRQTHPRALSSLLQPEIIPSATADASFKQLVDENPKRNQLPCRFFWTPCITLPKSSSLLLCTPCSTPPGQAPNSHRVPLSMHIPAPSIHCSSLCCAAGVCRCVPGCVCLSASTTCP